MFRQSVHPGHQEPHARWPRSVTGRSALVVAALEGVAIGLVLFVLPMIGEVLAVDLLPEILNTWVAPLLLVAVTSVVAALSVVAWRRGDRSTVGQVVMIVSLVGGALLAADVVLEAQVGR